MGANEEMARAAGPRDQVTAAPTTISDDRPSWPLLHTEVPCGTVCKSMTEEATPIASDFLLVLGFRLYNLFWPNEFTKCFYKPSWDEKKKKKKKQVFLQAELGRMSTYFFVVGKRS